jgi:hypothetical protein
MRCRISSILVLALAAGCRPATFDLQSPVAAVITSEGPFAFSAPPLRYELQASEDRLVIKIWNDTDETILLQGAESAVVDPDGRSHPLQSQTMAGHSFVKLILPPPRPWGTGGPVAFEFGMSDYPAAACGNGYADAGTANPVPAEPIETYDSPIYWNWTGPEPVRLELVYRRGEATFTQRFVIRKRD